MQCQTCPRGQGHNRPDHCACGQRVSINTRNHAKGCDYEWQNGQPLVATYAKGGTA